MQVTELSADGLKREYKIVVHADEIEDRVSGRLDRAQPDDPDAGLPARARCRSPCCASNTAAR